MQYPTGSFIDGLTNDWWDRPAGHGGRLIPPPPRAAASTSSVVAHHLNPAAYLLRRKVRSIKSSETGAISKTKMSQQHHTHLAHCCRLHAHPLLRLTLVHGRGRRKVCVHHL
jgi:hypothetical protein